ncbi:hypothetical protein G3I20_33575, partial [Streptomyces sp. SID8111]|nr:hypothetical protein [Streptomyces sp. SID8111]
HARPDAGAPERAEQRPGGDHATEATADSGDTDGVDGTGEERDDAPAVPAQRPAEMTMELLIPAPSRPGDDRPTGPEATPPAAADDSPTEPGTAPAT